MKRFVARSNLSALLGDREIALPAIGASVELFHAHTVANRGNVEMHTSLGYSQASCRIGGSASTAVHYIPLQL